MQAKWAMLAGALRHNAPMAHSQPELRIDAEVLRHKYERHSAIIEAGWLPHIRRVQVGWRADIQSKFVNGSVVRGLQKHQETAMNK
jgi:hypothetical protein